MPSLPVEDFDESTYLALNPDVADAVETGTLPSGWHHYITHGFTENRPGIPPDLNEGLHAFFKRTVSIEIPPAHLRKRIHGLEDASVFESTGRLVAFDLYRILKSTPLCLDEQSHFLDFGCGSGRVIKYVNQFYEDSCFYGSDIDPEAIAWCRQCLSEVAHFSVNQNLPPLSFPDGFFDVVYSLSVFSHLPQNMHLAWLKELSRITKVGGYLILTVHGPESARSLPDKEKAQFEAEGFFYAVRTRTEGLPDFYQITYHAEDYIRTHWRKYFEIHRIIKRSFTHNEDLVLLEKTTR